MKKSILILIYLLSNYAFSCSCHIHLFESFQNADFVAKVKFKNISSKDNFGVFKTATVEIIELYKGKNRTNLMFITNSSDLCSGLNITENSEWLLFAKINDNGELINDYCSGSTQIDIKSNSKDYPNADETHKILIEKEIEILKFLKKKKIKDINKFDLKISHTNPCESDFRGFEVTNQTFSIYKIKINKNLTIKKVTAIKEFDNINLSNEILKCLKQNTSISTEKTKEIEKSTTIYVIYYYYPAENDNKSFISDKDL